MDGAASGKAVGMCGSDSSNKGSIAFDRLKTFRLFFNHFNCFVLCKRISKEPFFPVKTPNDSQ
jgi:hypothetical protein